jgi:hypothetical protein
LIDLKSPETPGPEQPVVMPESHMNYAIIVAGEVIGFIVNATESEALQAVERHGKNATVVAVTTKESFPTFYHACTFGAEAATLTAWSRVKLWYRSLKA